MRKVYHGAVQEITNPLVHVGRENLDFGKGFYMAVDRTQAIGMMHKKYREAVRRRRNKKETGLQEHLYQRRYI